MRRLLVILPIFCPSIEDDEEQMISIVFPSVCVQQEKAFAAFCNRYIGCRTDAMPGRAVLWTFPFSPALSDEARSLMVNQIVECLVEDYGDVLPVRPRRTHTTV